MAILMKLSNWGARPHEIRDVIAGDDIISHATLTATRCVSLSAPPDEVFPWIRQMGFGKAGWYSYDWLDNLGRRSATNIHPEWQNVNSGDLVPAGPISFTAVHVEPPHSFVLEVKSRNTNSPRLHFTLAYELRNSDAGTRLVTRMRAHIAAPGGRFIEQTLLGPGDGIMLRRQLLNLAQRINR